MAGMFGLVSADAYDSVKESANDAIHRNSRYLDSISALEIYCGMLESRLHKEGVAVTRPNELFDVHEGCYLSDMNPSEWEPFEEMRDV